MALVQHGTLINALIVRKSALVFTGVVENGLALLFTRIIIRRKRLVFCHLVNLVCCRIFIRCSLINLFFVVLRVDLRLIAILQPIVEIVPELFEQVHIAGLTVLLVAAYVLPCPRRHILLLFTIHEFRHRLDFLRQTIQHIIQADFQVVGSSSVNYVFAVPARPATQY